MTPYAALVERTRSDPARPLVTYLDLHTGERMELSAASVLNAVAKTAAMLRDDLDVETGQTVDIDLPLHWQRAIWWAACAFIGAEYRVDTHHDGPTRIVATHRAGAPRALASGDTEVAVVSLAPFGLPETGTLPDGVVDVAVAMRAHPDVFLPTEAPQDDWPLMTYRAQALTAGQSMVQAARTAAQRGLTEGSRFAVLADDPDQHLLQLAVPLVVGGSVILVAPPAGPKDPGLTTALDREGAELTHRAS